MISENKENDIPPIQENNENTILSVNNSPLQPPVTQPQPYNLTGYNTSASTIPDDAITSFLDPNFTVQLTWKDVKYKIGDRVILDGLSGEINPGEVCARNIGKGIS